jgi:hypothetical protein
MGKRETRTPITHLVCPCCQQERRVLETPWPAILVRNGYTPERAAASKYVASCIERILRFAADVHQTPAQTSSIHHTHAWACDVCVGAGRALAADTTRQRFGMGGPIVSYIPHDLRCRTCAAAFVFTPAEQQRWYELHQFWIDSIPRDCPACRSRDRACKRAHAEIAAILADPTPTPELLDRLAAAYRVIGSDEKAALAERRAANLRR